MNSRERVLAAINHEEADRVPIDLGSTCVTSINLKAYGNLRRTLGMKGGAARVFHTWVQTPEVEPEIAERLHVDTVTLPRYKMSLGIPNADFKPWQFVDGTDFLVPVDFTPRINDDGDFEWWEHGVKIAEAPKEGTQGFAVKYFPLEHATTEGEIDDWFDNYYGNFMGRIRVTDEELVWAREFAQRLRATTDKAIVSDYVFGIIFVTEGILGFQNTYMSLLNNPGLIRYFFDRLVHEQIVNLKRYLGAVGEYIDVIMGADDVGAQKGPMIKVDTFREFLLPGHKLFCETVHENSNAKVLFHTDGSVMPFLQDLIDIGVDCFNTVQTDAADMDAMEMQKRFGNNLTFWGGGVDTHHVLPRGTPDEVREDVRRRMKIFGPGGGFVFSAIHNILGDVPPENILAAFDAAAEFGRYPIMTGTESQGELAAKLTAANYWEKPLQSLRRGDTPVSATLEEISHKPRRGRRNSPADA
ncbi:MAG: hypothetical protein J5I90_14650 [Caldilineales bacterium]|nr:hypothetical protein [Caldilineales bacterium]